MVKPSTMPPEASSNNKARHELQRMDSLNRITR